MTYSVASNIDCSDAIFDVKSTVSQFVEHSNCVYAAALDLKKAFDRVSYFKLFNTLIDSGVSIPVVNVVSNWFSKLLAAIQWNSSLSYTFSVGSGVRQGSSLSPTLFNLYINAIIVSLKSSDYGCQARGKFFGCFLYA